MRKLLSMILIACLTVAFSACPASTAKKLAVASDAVSHALLTAQAAVRQGVADGVISAQDDAVFEAYLVKAAQAGLVLDQGIRANQAAGTVSGEVNSFLDAFNQLNTTGVAGIKNKNLQLTVSTILNGAEASLAVIAAAVGSK